MKSIYRLTLFSVLLSFILCFSSGVSASDIIYLGTTALAEDTYYVIDDTTGELTTTGASDSEFQAYYKDGVLNLQNLEYNNKGYLVSRDTGKGYYGIYAEQDITIKYTGYNSFTIGDGNIDDSSVTYNYGIFSNGNITIEGVGDDTDIYYDGLEINCGDVYGYSIALVCNGNLTLKNADVSAYAGRANDQSIGVASAGKMSLDNSYLTGTSGDSTGYTIGIYASLGYTAKDSYIFATADISQAKDSLGLASDVDPTETSPVSSSFENCMVRGTGLGSNQTQYDPDADEESNVGNSVGIRLDNVTFDDCELYCFSRDVQSEACWSQGIYALKCDANDCNIYAEATDSCGRSYGINIKKLTISGCDIKSMSTNTITDDYGAFYFVPEYKSGSDYYLYAGDSYNNAKYIADPSVLTSPSPYVWLTETANPFTDMNSSDWFYTATTWGIDQNITKGRSSVIFDPAGTCTRGEMVTFIWRFHNCPEPVSTSTTFKDISPDDYYYKAVLWAQENGVVNGITSTQFAPDAKVTRAQALTFIWRDAGSEVYEDISNDFEDICPSDYYYNAVIWGTENGITKGRDNTHFSPTGECKRSEIITFLYRYNYLYLG